MHKIVKCKKCQKIIYQCRCMSKSKLIELIICEECEKAKEESANDKSVIEFKLGDMVEVLTESYYHYRRAGDIGKIVKIRDGCCDLEFKDNGKSLGGNYKNQCILNKDLKLHGSQKN